MHELAIAEGIVEGVSERLGEGARVTRVFLEVGRLSCVEPGALRFCFEVCARGTCAEGAALECVEVPGLARCERCGAEVTVEGAALPTCECGSGRLEIVQGERLRVVGLEVV